MRDDSMPTYESSGCSLETKPRSWFWYGRFEGEHLGWAPPAGLLPRLLYWLGHVIGRQRRRR